MYDHPWLVMISDLRDRKVARGETVHDIKSVTKVSRAGIHEQPKRQSLSWERFGEDGQDPTSKACWGRRSSGCGRSFGVGAGRRKAPAGIRVCRPGEAGIG